MKKELLDQLVAARRARRAVALVSDVKTGAQRLVAADEAAPDSDLAQAFRFDKSALVGDEFFQIHNPPLRLVLIGAVLIAQSVIPIARATGYDVTVVDPRGAFATGARFPDIALHAEWPQDILPGFGLDRRTAFIALTHDPKIDDEGLDLALKSDAFYIGALGSRKSHAARLARLKARGFDEATLARIRGPIGLAIGAVGAPEIAISIMAEMTKALRLGLT
ncbi:XdhC family protein [Aestuariivirga litoralis]|uniref:XdhC family protein n=1 Tax=Aestuariivirga litoralis TaxID=2650924 RepID=UPI0018C779C7|nr:XdhC family protein [Aestuariivirga litoralis]MBG1231274.1 XdhC family protein [Aestuariivirga litoralis]